MIYTWKQFLKESADQKEKTFNFDLNIKVLENYLYQLTYNGVVVSIDSVSIDTNDKVDFIYIGVGFKPAYKINIRYNNNTRMVEDETNHVKNICDVISDLMEVETDIFLIDPNEVETNEEFTPIDDKLEGGFDNIKIGKSIVHIDSEGSTTTAVLDIYIVSKETFNMTTEGFVSLYDLSGFDHIKDNKIYIKVLVKDLAEILAKNDDYIDKYYESEDFHEFVNIDSDYMFSDVVSSINSENKIKLFKKIFELFDFNTINTDYCDGEFESEQDLIDNVSDAQLKEIIKDNENEILPDLYSYYSGQLNDKWYNYIQKMINNEVIDYIEKYLNISDITLQQNSDYKNELIIWFDPNELIDKTNYYSGSNMIEEISGSNLYDTFVDNIKENHDRQINFESDSRHDEYLDTKEINDILKELLD